MKRRSIFITLCIIVAFCGALRAQDKKDLDRTSVMDLMSKVTTVPGEVATVPMEGVVDQMKYIVGPSDVFSINVWSLQNVSYRLSVTPEGTLVIPTVGEVRVSGLTLTKARSAILDAIKKKYISGSISATLISPRKFIVAVTGNVLNPGSYIAMPVERVDKVIIEACRMTMPTNTVIVEPSPMVTFTPTFTQQRTALEQFQKNTERNQASQILENISTRNIVIYRRDGTTTKADLPKYFATGEDKYNPFVLDGDVIFVPRKDVGKSYVSIYGAVNQPGVYEYASDDSVYSFVKIAGGFMELVDLDNVRISRLSDDGKSEANIVVDMKGIVQRNAKDIPLQRGDRIVVGDKLQQKGDYKVYLQGEVLHPGVFPITKENTKLSELVKISGGFTDYAYLPGSQVIRGGISQTDANIEKLLSYRLANLSREDTSYYNLETNIRILRGLFNVDFKKLFMDRDTSQDITLRDGDIIIIPSVRQAIYVYGQVINPGYVPYAKGKDFEYYVQHSGGYAEEARSGDSKIVKWKTQQWMSPGDTEIEPGDFIWVPKIPERGLPFYLNILSGAASVASVIIGVAVLVLQLRK
jgi:protein involved in polysaccharide export with SLBB domain